MQLSLSNWIFVCVTPLSMLVWIKWLFLRYCFTARYPSYPLPVSYTLISFSRDLLFHIFLKAQSQSTIHCLEKETKTACTHMHMWIYTHEFLLSFCQPNPLTGLWLVWDTQKMKILKVKHNGAEPGTSQLGKELLNFTTMFAPNVKSKTNSKYAGP